MKRVGLSIMGGFVALLSLATAVEKGVPERNDLTLEKQRIVVMDFGALDTIYALGEIDRVVGFPQGNRPEYLDALNDEQRYFNTGGMKSPDFAAIKEHTPDLIITSPRQGESLEQLQRITEVYPYTIDQANYLPSLKAQILTIGEMINRQEEANQAWSKLEATIKKERQILEKSELKALVVLHNDGKIWASNRSGFAHLIYHTLGVKVADPMLNDQSEAVTVRYLQMRNPDIIYIIDRSAAIGQTPLDSQFFTNPKLAEVAAVKEGRVIYLTPKLWYLSGNGLISLPRQIEEVLGAFKVEK